MSRMGDTIKKARLKAKMTEKALARKCGLAEVVIVEIEAGRRIVSDEQAQRILKVLGVEDPLSTELDVAAEPEPAPKVRPKPRPYVKSFAEPAQVDQHESPDAWMDALAGVVKRVPVIDLNGLVIDHVLTPIIGGKIEGGAPDKVFFCRVPDDMLRGFRIHAGDLLLTIPETHAYDNAIMLIEYKGKKQLRKLLKMDGMRIQMQAFDSEFDSVIATSPEVRILGRCVRLQRNL